MRFESILEPISADGCVDWKHAGDVVPPKTSCASKLLRREQGLVLFGALSCEHIKLGPDGVQPCISIKRLICLAEQRWLGGEEVGVASYIGVLLLPMTLLLVELNCQLPQDLCLIGDDPCESKCTGASGG